MKDRRIGKFYVSKYDTYAVGGGRFDALRAAQAGCAVLRCEMLEYMDAFEVIAEHPAFAPTPIAMTAPEYDCVFTKTIGGEIVRTFKRKGA